MASTKTYLGDGVYVWHDGYQLWLETNDGYDVTNRIALDDRVYAELVHYGYQRGLQSIVEMYHD